MSNISPAFESDAAEIERNAYNAAFHALGLRWYWDIDTYNELQLVPVDRGRVRIYLETYQPHLLAAYDAEFLVNAIETKKAHCREQMTWSRSGVSPYCNWAEVCREEVGA